MERPGYKKFRVADLGINIVENPSRKKSKKPKEYTIMESLQSNPVYSPRGTRGEDKEKTLKVLVFSQTVAGKPYTCFSNGTLEACYPFEWQMTSSILSRLIIKAGKQATQVKEEIAEGGSIIRVSESDFNSLLKDAERFGKVIDKKREMEVKKAQDEDVFLCSDFKGFRFLSSCLN